MSMVINSNNEQIQTNYAPIQLFEYDNYPNKTIFPLHWHKDFELLFIDKGELHLNIAGKEYDAHAGDTVIINPYYTHEGFTTESSCAHRALIFDLTPLCENQATRTLLNDYLSQNAAFLFIVQDDDLREIVTELFAVKNQENPEVALLHSSLLYRLLFLLLSRHRNTDFRIPTHHKRIKKVVDYINKHYCEDISTASISEMFGYDDTYFSRLFKAVTSLRPTEYIRILRLEKARHLLAESNNSIASVAEACGFSDLNYFSRCFKTHYGITASQHRKSKRQMIATGH